MESDVTASRKALDLLQRQYGKQLAGPKGRAQDQMRATLQQQMDIDALLADSLLKKLSEDGRLVYVSTGADTDTAPEGQQRDNNAGATDTGPVISMPLTQTADGGTPLITTASPDQLMGITTGDSQGDVAQNLVEISDTGNGADIEYNQAGARGGNQADSAPGYWRIG